ncbi:MAG: class I SAM-dependent methyltransferase [Deltaproteobacteria bacterium]|nr:class I SAM-dependent methyltransferase [Deltaproteobacteria bacterium]
MKPVSKSRLARYGIDLFLHKISATVKPHARLLDGGAGNCKYPHFFPQARTTAMDMKPQRKRRYGELDVAGNLYMIPFKADVFDGVVNIEVLEHLREPLDALKEMFRVLRPGGRLILVAPQGWEEHGAPNDYFRFTKFGLRYLFEKAGFRVVSIEPLGGYFWYLGHRIAVSYRYLFPSNRSKLWKFLDAPVRHPARLFLRKFIPYLCFHLDPLDKQRSYTLNYGCVCEKPADGSSAFRVSG